jgi:hypothetical protein
MAATSHQPGATLTQTESHPQTSAGTARQLETSTENVKTATLKRLA